MNRSVKLRHLVLAVVALAALLIASPALGGPSLRSLVKKEVAKQLAGKTGPPGAAGAAGAAGAPGAAGANGTARAFGYMDKFFCQGTLPFTCTATTPHSSNVTSIQQVATGHYCVTVTGLSPSTSPAVATVDASESFPGNATNAVQWASLGSGACSSPKYEFDTFDPADPNANVDTSFSFVIP
jgi:hypothetical protein